MNNKKINIYIITEAGITLALAYVLNLFPLYAMPYGGEVSLAMLPIAFFAIKNGAGLGITVGALYGIINLLIKPTILHPIQVLLDYPLPSAFIGIAGFSFSKDKDNIFPHIFGLTIAYILKFISHFLSGLVFFPQYAPEGMEPAWYSFIYNIQYTVPELILIAIVLIVLWKPLKEIFRRQTKK